MNKVTCCCLALVAGSLLADSKLLENGDFETLDASGNPGGWSRPRAAFAYEKGAGRNFTRAAVVTQKAGTYDFPARPVTIKGGNRYHLEGWVRTENVTGVGARIGIDPSTADGKYLHGYYTQSISGTTPGWHKLEIDFDAAPEVASGGVCCFITKGCTGKAYFDDIRLELAERPVLGAVVSSAYRNRLRKGKVMFSASVTESEKVVAEKGLTAVWRIADGKTSWIVRRAPVEDGYTRIELDVESLPMGRHPVQVSVVDRAGQSLGMLETWFERVREFPQKGVYIDEEGRTIVEGKPFFPLGMFVNNQAPADVDEYAKGPFNTVMSYHPAMPEVLAKYQAKGLKVIGCLKDAFAGSPYPPAVIKCAEDESAYIAARVAAVKDNPALLAWYANDELSTDWVDRLRKRRDLFERLDPDHPVWTVQYQIKDYPKYLGTYDVAGTDPYPIGSKVEKENKISMPGEWTRLTRKGAGGIRGIWQVPQCFAVESYFPNRRGKTRHPTQAELANMAWQCIAEGANGLIFYAYHALTKQGQDRPFSETWPEMCAVAAGIREKFDVLLSDDATASVSVTEATPHVSVRAWRTPKGITALVVNGCYDAGRVTLTVGGESRTLELARLSNVFEEFPE